jgi:hypothetical protein
MRFSLGDGEEGRWVFLLKAHDRFSLEHWLEPLLARVQKRISDTQTKIVCSEGNNHRCTDTRSEV